MHPASRGQMRRDTREQNRGWITPSTRMLTRRLGTRATRGLWVSRSNREQGDKMIGQAECGD